MKTPIKTLIIIFTLILPMSAYAAHHGDDSSGGNHPKAIEKPMCEPGKDCPAHKGMKHHVDGGALQKVEANLVCMINDTFMNVQQIPTKVDGKIYYGCCPMCKEKLEKSAEARTATDPVSGNKVDKATAIIGAQADGRVHYFENEENMKKFDAQKHLGSHQHSKECVPGEDCPVHEGMKHPEPTHLHDAGHGNHGKTPPKHSGE